MSPQSDDTIEVHRLDGSIHIFPGSASPDAIAQTLALHKGETATPPQESWRSAVGSISNPAIDFARPLAAEGLGDLAAGVAGGASFGLAAPAAKVGTYTVTDAALQQLRRLISGEPEPNSPAANALGLKPGSVGATLANTGQMAAENAVFKKLIQAPVAAYKAARDVDVPDLYRLAPTTGQAANLAKAQIPQGWNGNIPNDISNKWLRAKLSLLGTSRTIEGFNSKAVSEALDRSAKAGTTEALNLTKDLGFDLKRNPFNGQMQPSWEPLAPISGDMPGIGVAVRGLNYTDAIDKVYNLIDNPGMLEKYLSAAQSQGVDYNVKKALQQAQFSRIWNKAAILDTNGETTRINVKGFSDLWNDPVFDAKVVAGGQSSKQILFNASDRSDIEQFFKNIEATQGKTSTFPVAKPLMMARGGIEISKGLAASMIGGLGGLAAGGSEGAAIGGASMVGVILSGDAIARGLTNRKTARFLVNLAGGEAPGASEQFIGKVLANVLNGTTMALRDAKGNVTPGKLVNGRFIPAQAQ